MSNLSNNCYATNLPQIYYSNNMNNNNNNHIINNKNYTALQKEFILPSFKNLLTTLNHTKLVRINDYAYISPPNSNDLNYHTETISPLSLLPQQQQPLPASASAIAATKTSTTNNTHAARYSLPHYIYTPPVQIIRPEQLNPHFLQQQQQQQIQMNYNNNISASYPRSLPVYIPNINMTINQQSQPQPQYQQQENVLLPQNLPTTTALKNHSAPTNNVATATTATTATATASTIKKSDSKTVKSGSNKRKNNNNKIKKKRKQRIMKKNKKISNIKDLLNPISKRSFSSSSSNKKCFQCQETNTPEWRLGPYGSRSLCNACGLYYRRLIQRYDLKQANLIMRFNRFIQPTNVRQVPSHIEIPHDIIKQFDMDPTLDNNYNTIN